MLNFTENEIHDVNFYMVESLIVNVFKNHPKFIKLISAYNLQKGMIIAKSSPLVTAQNINTHEHAKAADDDVEMHDKSNISDSNNNTANESNNTASSEEVMVVDFEEYEVESRMDDELNSSNYSIHKTLYKKI